jgi:alginate O-acetyltransferase complex protein AlgI
MAFNSIVFGVFLIITFSVYWGLGTDRRKPQNLFLLCASYVFYGWWDWRFLCLIVASTGLNYVAALGLEKAKKHSSRKWILRIAVCFSLGLLGFFKYFNFFTDSLIQLLNAIGFQTNHSTLYILLPVGISFYTFQAISYTIDVYRGHLKATRDPVSFFTYVAFFPQLVAGPIERATHLLPQFERARSFDRKRCVSGLQQILWGLFTKVVIADNCAIYANEIYSQHTHASSLSLVLGTFYFAIQIYGDFCGYSNVAIGVSRLFGFDLMRNFAYPYFSRDIAEFWRKWHISLNTWFRDYVYIPLGGSKGGKPRLIRNVVAVFLLSGLWHGAQWTYVAWGAMNALLFIPLLLSSRNRVHTGEVAPGRNLPSSRELLQILCTFTLVNMTWVFFRAESFAQAIEIYGRILGLSQGLEAALFVDPMLATLLLIFIALEWSGRNHENPLAACRSGNPFLRRGAYLITAVAVLLLGPTEEISFIYFQF